jgi:predicted nucleic acid-binding protein
MPKRPRVLDSWAVVAFIEAEEPAAEKMEAIFAEAHESNTPMMITAVNLGEVWYSLARTYSENDADTSVARLLQLGIEVIVVDWELARQAAGFKVKGNISYADCFAAALAKQHKAELVTGDKEFRQVENLVTIIWL